MDCKPRIIGPDIGQRPAWAKALIVAEYETDQSEIQSDYFATRTEATVPLAWSRHTRDLFSEMRKAADLFKPTRHLGPGKGVYTVRVVMASERIESGNGGCYWEGSRSHWHGEPATFDTLAATEAFLLAQPAPEPLSFDGVVAEFRREIEEERIEHREKYSMGAGYYLKASGGYSTGWTVSKQWLPKLDGAK